LENKQQLQITRRSNRRMMCLTDQNSSPVHPSSLVLLQIKMTRKGWRWIVIIFRHGAQGRGGGRRLL
jgi:hypothetical protein